MATAGKCRAGTQADRVGAKKRFETILDALGVDKNVLSALRDLEDMVGQVKEERFLRGLRAVAVAGPKPWAVMDMGCKLPPQVGSTELLEYEYPRDIEDTSPPSLACVGFYGLPISIKDGKVHAVKLGSGWDAAPDADAVKLVDVINRDGRDATVTLWYNQNDKRPCYLALGSNYASKDHVGNLMVLKVQTPPDVSDREAEGAVLRSEGMRGKEWFCIGYGALGRIADAATRHHERATPCLRYIPNAR